MAVVIDTSILFRDMQLDQPVWKELADALSATGRRIIVPVVAWRELTTRALESVTERHQDLVEARDKSNRRLESLSRASGLNLAAFPEPPSLQDVLDGALTQLEMRRENFGIEIAPIPSNVSHEHVIERLQGGRKPFRGKRGSRDVGYRDYLIWLTVLDIAAQEPEFGASFVSANTGDFALNDSELHPELTADVESLNLDVRYYPTLEDFAIAEVRPTLDSTVELFEGVVEQLRVKGL